MSSSGPGLGDIQEFADIPEQHAFKISALIGVKLSWSTIPANKLFNHDHSNGFGLLVWHGIGLCELGEVVGNNQNIFITSFGQGQGTQNIHGDTLQGRTHPVLSQGYLGLFQGWFT